MCFSGVPLWQKGYKLLNLYSHSTLFSRDVFFPEHMFPYHLPPSSTFPSPTFDFTDAPTPTSFVPSPAPVSLSPAPVSLSPAPVSSSLGVFSSPHSSSIHVPPPPVLRRFGRTVNPSIYFNDYVCSYVLPSSSVSLNPKVSTSDLHMLEPQFYQHTASHSTWQEAMLKEFEALEANHTWELSPCLLIRKLSHASGYTRSSRNLIALLRGIRRDLLLGVTLKGKALIILRPSLLLSNLLLSNVSFLLLSRGIGLYFNLMSIVPSFMVIYMRKCI